VGQGHRGDEGLNVVSDDFFSPAAEPAPKKTIPIVPEAKPHAYLSSSSSGRWTMCHVAPRREEGQPDNAQQATRDGTVMHDLAEKCLKAGDDIALSQALGKDAFVQGSGTVLYCMPKNDGLGTRIDDEFVEHTQVYIDFVRKMAMGGELLVEERLSIEHITGEPDAKGTSDSVIIFPEELCIIDLKGGFKKVFAKYKLDGAHFITAPKSVQQDAIFGQGSGYKPNTQLLMYAEAARETHSLFHDFKRVRMIIVMPRIGFVDEHVMEMEEFLTWVQWVREQAEATRSPDAKAFPHEDVCTYCKAFPCPEADQAALEIALGDFDDLDKAETIEVPDAKDGGYDLGRLKQKVPFLRKFCDAVEAKVFAELSLGRDVHGWKMVLGDEGDRAWSDEAKAEQALGSFGLSKEERTTAKVINPAQTEKMVQGKRSPNRKLTRDQWDALQPLISRSPAGPKVVPADDPRPILQRNPADDFDDDFETQPANDENADFF
jgi:hypothetical protein